jgi:5-keto 4-deoxyuronate isomerase
MESKWFGVPCITYEKRTESLIYLVDDSTIFHVKSKDEFIQKVNNLISEKKKEKLQLKKVADSILETLMQ